MLKLILITLFYFAPSLWAAYKNRKSFILLFVINVLLGWTIIGVVACLIWAIKGKNDQQANRKWKLISVLIMMVFFVFVGISKDHSDSVENMTPEERQEQEKQQALAKEKRDREAAAKGAAAEKAAVEKFCTNKTDAFVMSQQFVEKRLKAPSTAKFPSITNDEVSVVLGKDCAVTVWGYVDSQNGFGAMLRSHYRLELKGHPYNDSWQLKSIDID